jgi:single-stranded DNA-specific DHH superfamily exonuclease
VTAFSWILLLPLYILAALVLVLGTFALLGRIKGGKYLRPVVQLISKVPLFRKGLQKASTAALERQNPDLASAIKKMERMGATTDPRKAQTAIGRLTPAERRAYMAAAQEQGATDQMPQNRQMRRKLEKMQREGRRGGS